MIVENGWVRRGGVIFGCSTFKGGLQRRPITLAGGAFESFYICRIRPANIERRVKLGAHGVAETIRKRNEPFI